VVHGIPTHLVASHVWYISRTSIGDNFEFVSLFCFTLFFSFAICSHNESGEGIETIQGTEFSQVNFGRYTDFSLTVSQLIHPVHSVRVIRARSICTTVFMGAVSSEYPLSTAVVRLNGLNRYWSIWRTQDSTRELFTCYLQKTSYSVYQPSLAINFMISYGGNHNGR
jgi:hypothetical protein